MKNDKFFKYQALTEDPELNLHNPETYLFSKDNLFKMLESYKEIMIKPVSGSFGKNIRKVTKMDNGTLQVHYNKEKFIVKDKYSLYRFLNKIETLGRKSFMIQKYISLAKVDGRPIDFRYIVQRKKDTPDWVITGKHAKVAVLGYIITNLQVGGSGNILSVEKALKKSNIENLNLNHTLQSLDRIALLASKCLTRSFEKHTIWGYDMAVDETGHVWIIEANSAPLVGGFRYLDDRTMYETINSFIDYNK